MCLVYTHGAFRGVKVDPGEQCSLSHSLVTVDVTYIGDGSIDGLMSRNISGKELLCRARIISGYMYVFRGRLLSRKRCLRTAKGHADSAQEVMK